MATKYDHKGVGMHGLILVLIAALLSAACASQSAPDLKLEAGYKVSARKYCSEYYDNLSSVGYADCVMDEYHRALRIGSPAYYAKHYPYGHQPKTKYEKKRPKAESEKGRSKIKIRPPAEEIAKSSRGSCFFVSQDGLVVTNHHVVAGKNGIKVIDNNANTFAATLFRSDPANDLAILRVETQEHSYLTLAQFGALKTGQKIFTVGYPVSNVLGTEAKFTDGVVSSTTGIQNMANMFQMTVPIQPGNSGGPVLNESGQVVGVATSSAAIEAFYQNTGALPQNVNWAIKSDYVSLLTGVRDRGGSRGSRQDAIDAAIAASCMVQAT